MPDKLSNRDDRHSINTLMVYSDVKGKFKFKNATLYNFNKEGLYFETNEKLIPGTEIVVEITNYMPGPYSPEGSDTYNAIVKWCKPIEDSDGYSVGTEITGNSPGNKKIMGNENPCNFPFDGQAQ